MDHEGHPVTVTLPCGRCRYCRLEHSRQWAVRCFHEASLYEKNCFVTLTYAPEHVPAHGSLDYSHPVLFMKRLRERFGPQIRSFGCAEYGEKFLRPHYHLCLFNFDFSDKKPLSKKTKNPLYISDSLSDLWTFGHHSIGAFSFETAAYVARYVTKKITGPAARDHYEVVDELGEVHERLPERSICVSRRPGLGRGWYDKYGQFSRDHDFVVREGVRGRPPKYYDRVFEALDGVSFEAVKKRRREAGEASSLRLEAEDVAARKLNFAAKPRLYVMEEVQELKFRALKRGYENG